jgi:Carboxypeptidase regulatory-like domain
MHSCTRKPWLICIVLAIIAIVPDHARAQGMGTSGEIDGTVTDSTGAALRGAAAEISNPVSGYRRTTTTNETGGFRFTNVPFNRYHMKVSAPDFASQDKDIEVRSSVPAQVSFALFVVGTTMSVTVEASSEDLKSKTFPPHIPTSTAALRRSSPARVPTQPSVR